MLFTLYKQFRIEKGVSHVKQFIPRGPNPFGLHQFRRGLTRPGDPVKPDFGAPELDVNFSPFISTGYKIFPLFEKIGLPGFHAIC
jgi:hypothetical protein